MNIRPLTPELLFGLRLWASVSLALLVAFWLELDNAYWAGTSAAIVSQPLLGASLRKGWFRMLGTVAGATVIVVLTACFPQQRVLFLGSLALWSAACCAAATLLRHFAGYGAGLAGVTAVVIASDQLGATGGVNGEAFSFAVTRVSEICIGIVAAGVVLAGTDFGAAPRRLAALMSNLCAEITSGFVGTLSAPDSEFSETKSLRREFIRRVIAIGPIIDQSIGESSRLRYHSPVLQQAVDGLFAALDGWRAVSTHLVRLPEEQAREDAGTVLGALSPELLDHVQTADPVRWMGDPVRLHRTFEQEGRRLLDRQVGTLSRRLLADQTAAILAGMAKALNGLALLVADPARRRISGTVHLRVADWLPAFVNGARAFAAICAVQIFWIVSAWPDGALAMTYAAVSAVLLAAEIDQAPTVALEFAVGTALSAALAAIIGFMVLPQLASFEGFSSFAGLSLALGLVLVPIGIGIAQPWHRPVFIAAASFFCPLLGPANQMTYDPSQFYNNALAILSGLVAAALSFRLLPPLSPAFRTRRLLALTLRDLRRLARGGPCRDWEGHVHGRLSAMPEEATALQRAQLVAALSVGSEIIRLRQIAVPARLGLVLEPAFAAVALGDTAGGIARLVSVDAALAVRRSSEPLTQTLLRARAAILALSEALSRHAMYFSLETNDAVLRD